MVSIYYDITGSADLLANDVKFITFNYDVSLEFWLHRALTATEVLKERDVNKFLAYDRIVHVYGSVSGAGAPWERPSALHRHLTELKSDFIHSEPRSAHPTTSLGSAERNLGPPKLDISVEKFRSSPDRGGSRAIGRGVEAARSKRTLAQNGRAPRGARLRRPSFLRLLSGPDLRRSDCRQAQKDDDDA
jgi:hypothetical protein